MNTARSNRILALWWASAVVAGIALGALARSPFQPVGGSKVFPRLPGPPPDVPTLLYLIGVGSVAWYVSLVAFPALLLGARLVQVEDGSRWRVVALAVASVVGLFAFSAGVDYALTYQGAPSSPRLDAYLPLAVRQQLLPFIALVGVVVAIEGRRRARAHELERERLRAIVAEQRLVALTTQLQPHFLFNTLQSISTLLHRDVEAADEMLAKLSDLLRELLRHRDRAIVSLDEEIGFITIFLEIAQVRFADRLRFSIDVPAELRTGAVPLFVLQPLVENALAHGIGRQAAGGSIRISASRIADRLQIDVTDDGAGVAESAADGIGLSNTRERLQAAFGDAQSFSLVNRAGGGAVASVSVPWRVAR